MDGKAMLNTLVQLPDSNYSDLLPDTVIVNMSWPEAAAVFSRVRQECILTQMVL